MLDYGNSVAGDPRQLLMVLDDHVAAQRPQGNSCHAAHFLGSFGNHSQAVLSVEEAFGEGEGARSAQPHIRLKMIVAIISEREEEDEYGEGKHEGMLVL